MIDVLDAAHPSSPLLRETLARHRLHLLEIEVRQSSDVRLPEGAVHFLRRQILSSHGQRHRLGALLVDAELRPVAYTLPYLGCLRGRDVDPRAFLAPGLLVAAAGLMLFHHRPAESPTPSRHVQRIARRVRDAAEHVGLRLLDYLLLGRGDAWTSLRLSGSLPLLSLGDPSPLACSDRRRRVKPKYRNPEQPNQTWSGRGQMARWLRDKLAAGASLADFLIVD